jgi:spore germination protein GerM
MNRLLPLLLILSLLAGCGNRTTETAEVYRVVAPEYQTVGTLLISEEIGGESGSSLETLLMALQQPSTTLQAYNPLNGIKIIDCTVTDGTAVLSLDESFLDRTALEQSLIGACCVLTLCALPEIDRLSISVAGELVVQNLSAADILTDSAMRGSDRREVSLFYLDADGIAFSPEYRALSIPEGTGGERRVVEELLRAPEGKRPPLPAGTGLLGVTRQGRAVTLNLSAAFLENRPESDAQAVMAVYGLVNSLISLGNISEVLITVEGDPVAEYGRLNLSGPLTELHFLPTERPAAGQAVSARLYYAAGGSLLGLPCVLVRTDTHQELLDDLMYSGDLGGCSSLFAAGDALTHLNTSMGVCQVSVDRSFFERRTLDAANLALDALVLSLQELDDVRSVLVTYSDGTSPALPGRDLSQPILTVPNEIIQ